MQLVRLGASLYQAHALQHVHAVFCLVLKSFSANATDLLGFPLHNLNLHGLNKVGQHLSQSRTTFSFLFRHLVSFWIRMKSQRQLVAVVWEVLSVSSLCWMSRCPGIWIYKPCWNNRASECVNSRWGLMVRVEPVTTTTIDHDHGHCLWHFVIYIFFNEQHTCILF